MKTVQITASGSYQVHIGSGVLQQLHRFLPSVTKAAKAVIISDSNVFPLYGKVVSEQLHLAGIQCCESFVFPAGEESKTGATYLKLLNHLATNQITRTDCLIALGGGVTGDLTGFAAATYLRGIDYIQVPASLLAAVDSSVGGKTAIDLDAGKNLAGAFYQPKLVVCDTNTLSSLPQQIFLDGCAEVIKYGVLYDPAFFDTLLQSGPNFNRENVIARCIELKRDVVAADEFDRGDRQRLNLGHTLGHSIEAASQFSISHGQAVAIGMSMVAKAGTAIGITEEGVYTQICNILDRFSLPRNCPFDATTIFNRTLSDKKRSAGSVNLIIPETIGKCVIVPIAIENLYSFIEKGL